jgi:hypothetical protein
MLQTAAEKPPTKAVTPTTWLRLFTMPSLAADPEIS